jgi:hypothetical protein
MATFVLAIAVTTAGPANAAYRIAVSADAVPYDEWADPITFTEIDGVTSATVDTGWRVGVDSNWEVSDNSSVAKGAATANLATGNLHVYAGAKGIRIYREGRAYGQASFQDTLTFDLPEGMSQAPVTLSLTIDGVFDINDGAWKAGTGADAYLSLWDAGASQYLVRESPTLFSGWSGDQVDLPFEVSGTAVVQENTSYSLYAMLDAGVQTQGNVLSAMDFLSTASLDIELPPGATFQSESGVLLTQTDDDNGVIPEPSTLAIWSLLSALGLAAGWYRRRRAA